MDITPTAQPAQANNSNVMHMLAALFASKNAAAMKPADALGKPAAGPAGASLGQAADTAVESAAPTAPGTKPPEGEDGLAGALRDVLKFFNAQPASASNDARYQKALTDAGIPASETGVGE